jgi:hypothetical protein
MKKIKFLGFIAILAVICLFITSCEFGGTLTIVNKTGATIEAYAISIESLGNIGNITKATKSIEDGKSATWEFNLDGEVSYSWAGLGSSINDAIPKKISISGGKDEVITAK